MKSSHDIWNVLHDGSIVEARSGVPGTVSFKVEIPYLCEVVAAGCTFLWVHLQGCTLVRFFSFESDKYETDLASIAALEPEVLSAAEEGAGLRVACGDGELFLEYEDAHCVLEGDVPLDFDSIGAASQKYWEDWERSCKEAR